MVASVLKLYFIGTALTVLAVLYGLVDSFGGLMYVQNRDHALDGGRRARREHSERDCQIRPPATKNIGA